MKTIYVTFEKTISCNLPVAVPDHWDHDRIMTKLHQEMSNADLNELLEDLDWDVEADPTAIYQVAGFMDGRDATRNDPPIYSFPDEPSLSHPDQLDLLGGA